MTESDRREQDNASALRERLTRLSEASLHINESLDLDAVLQGVLDSARALTDASYALITTIGQSGQVEDFLVSGLSDEESMRLWEMPDGPRFFEYLSSLPGPLRVADFAAYAASMGFPEFRPPVPVSSFIAAPIRHRGESVGNIHVAKSEPGLEFSAEDEETLVMFASQAALVIANARRHRDELRARADLEALIDTSPVGVVVFDARRGALKSFNRETARILEGLRTPGRPVEQLLEVLSIRRADGREVSLQELTMLQALSAAETIRSEEVIFRVPDERKVTVLMNATPIRSEEGELESVIVTMQDMTALEELERLRAEFLGMVSHELRTPLTSIRGSATTMLDATSDLDPAEMRQFLRIIVEQADSMRDLIGDLLDVARIETGTLPVSPEPADLLTLVDRARNIFLLSGGKNRLEIDLSPDLPLVMVDRRRIVQVIGNLLSNAARNSPESSPIRVSAVRDGVHVEVSVADEGRGIPAERLPYLFRKFSRVESGDDRGDTGLGLAICRGIVEAHGGRIRAESDGAGLGARFTFAVPAVEAATAGSHHTDAATPQDVKGKHSVLIVDDDPHTLRYVRQTLEDAGYVPVVTADPEEVLALVEHHQPSLVLLDLMLPGTDGIDLMRDIFGIADVPVIFLSAYGQDRVIAQAFEMGASDYVVKPFSPTELVARVGAALRRRTEPSHSTPSEPYRLGELTIDYAERLVTVDGRSVDLTAIEYRLLVELSISDGRVVTHEQLLRRVWSPKKPGNLRTLRTHLRRLRVKLGDDGTDLTYIVAEPRVGYRMAKADESRRDR